MWEKAEGLYKECLDLLRELKKTTPNSSSSSSSSDNSSKVDKRKGAEYKAESDNSSSVAQFGFMHVAKQQAERGVRKLSNEFELEASRV